jgi:hypothetical protein
VSSYMLFQYLNRGTVFLAKSRRVVRTQTWTVSVLHLTRANSKVNEGGQMGSIEETTRSDPYYVNLPEVERLSDRSLQHQHDSELSPETVATSLHHTST